MSYEIVGLNEFKIALNSMGKEAQPILRDAVNESGMMVYNEILKRAEGRAKASVKFKKAKANKVHIECSIETKPGYEWAVAYELGHRLTAWGKKTNKYIEGSSFMRRPFDENIEKAEDIIWSGFDKVMDMFGG